MAVTLTKINTFTGATEGEYLAISYSLLQLRATDESANTDGFLLTKGDGGSLGYKNSAGVLTSVDFGSGAVVLRAAGLYINNVLVTGTDARLYWLSGDGIQAAPNTSPFPIGDAFFVRALDTTSGTWGSSPAPTYDLSANPVSVTVNVTPVNSAPTAVVLANTVTSLFDDQDPVAALKVADIQVTDDFLGSNNISLSGADAALFEVIGSALYLKAGTDLNAATKASYAVTISVVDSAIAGSAAVTTSYTLSVEAAAPVSNTAPVVSAAIVLTAINEDSAALTITAEQLLANASDIDGDLLTVAGVTLTDVNAGTLTENEGGTWTFVPAANFNGDVSFNYSVSDGKAEPVAATATLVITAVNDAPVAVVAVAEAIEDAALVTGQLESTDADVLGATATYALTEEVAGLTLNANGSYSFDPSNEAYQYLAAGEELIVVANWTVTDDQDASDSSTLTITVTGTNDVPVASAPVVLTAIVEDSLVGLTFTAEELLANASDLDLTDTLSVADVALADINAGTLTANENGTWTFVPAANFNGDVTFTYTVSDGKAEPVQTSATLVVANDYADVSVDDAQPAQEGVTAVTQISSITLTGTVGDIADIYTVVIAGETIVYETTGEEADLDEITQGLFTLISGNANITALLTPLRSGNVITLTANEAGTGFSLLAEGTNATVGGDISTIVAAEAVENVEAVAAVAQVSSVTIAVQAIEIGDLFSVTINGTTLTYEANGTEASVADIARGLRDLIEADDNLIGVVSSVANGAVLTVTALVAGTPFAIDAAAVNATAGQFVSTATPATATANVVAVEAEAQSSTVAFGETRYDQGDVVTVTINAVDFSYAVQYGDTANTIRDALVGKINLDNNLAVTANGNVEGVLTIVADVAGDAFIVASTVVDVAYVDNADPAFNNSAAAREAVAQQATITLDTVAYDRGDTISGKINGIEFSYTVPRSNMAIDQIAHEVGSAIVTAAGSNVVSTGHANGIITITANEAGDYFTLTDVAVTEFAGTENVLIVTETQANDVADKQVTEFSLSGTPDAGDEFRVTVGDLHYVATAALNSSAEDMLNELAVDINRVSEVATATVLNSKLVVTANTAGVPFGVDKFVANATATANNTADSTAIAAVAATASTAQVSTVKFDSTVNIGDVYTVTVNNTTHSFTSAAGATLISVLNALVSRINAGAEKAEVTAVRSGSTLIVSSDKAGVAFTIAATDNTIAAPVATPTPNYTGEPGVAQVSRVELGQAAYDKGDIVSVTVAGTTYDYTVLGTESSNDIVTALVALMVNNATVVAVNNDGQLQLTAKVAGTAFVFGSAVTNVTFTANTLSHVTTTANDVADNQQATIDTGAAAWDAGDVISGTLNDVEFSYTVTGEETNNGVAIAVMIEISNAIGMQPVGVGYGGTDGKTVYITATEAGVPFTLVTNPVINASETDNSIAFDGETVDNVTAQRQVSEVDLGAAGYDAGDVITLTVAGSEFSYTVTGEEANNGVMVAALLQAINAHNQLAVTAWLGDANVLVLTADREDGTFTLETAVNNAGITDQLAELDTAVPLAEVLAVKQVTTATLTAVGDIGDQHSFTFTDDRQNSYTVTYTVDGTEGSPAGLAARIINAVNADADVSPFVTALPGDAGQILFQADVAGTPFTVTSDILDQAAGADDNGLAAGAESDVASATATRQVSTVTLSEGALDAGDVVSVTVTVGLGGSEQFSYTVRVGDDMAAVLNGLVTEIRASNVGVTASTDGLVLTLTEKSATTGGFSFVGSVNNVGVTETASADREFGAANVVAEDAVAQSVTLTPDAGALNPGDVLSVTLQYDSSSSVFTSYVVKVGDTAQLAMLGLVAAVEGNEFYAGLVTASAVGGVLTLTAKELNTDYRFLGELSDVAVSLTDATAVRSFGTENKVETAAVAQVSTVTLNEGALDVGDRITITYAVDGGQNHSQWTLVQGGDTLNSVLERLTTAITNDGYGVRADFAGSVLTLTAVTAGTGFTFTGDVNNVTVDDSATAAAPVTTAAATATPQQSSVTFSGLFDQGDTATVTIKGHAYTYSVQLGDDANAVVNGLIAAVAANEPVTLVNSGNGVLTLTANNAADDGFTVTAGVDDIGKTLNDASLGLVQAASAKVTAVSQVSTATFGDGSGSSAVNVGDIYSVTINQAVHTYTAVAGATMITVLNALRSRINAGDEGGAVTAVRSGTKLIISSDTAGTAFTLSATNTDNTAAVATPTANVVGRNESVEITNINFGEAGYDAGDVITLSINGNTYQVTLTEAISAAALGAKLATDISPAGFTFATFENGDFWVVGTAFNDPLDISVSVNNALTTNASPPAVTLVEGNVALDAAQVSSIMLSGTYDAGDVVTVTINGVDYPYTVKANETPNTVAAGLAEVIFAASVAGIEETAMDNTLQLKATTAGVSFTVSSLVTQVVVTNGTATAATPTANAAATSAQAQVDNITLTGPFDAGDIVTVTIGNTPFSYITSKDQLEAAVINELVDLINAGVEPVTAANVSGVLTLTADAAGTSFTATSEVTQVQVTDGALTQVDTAAADAVTAQQQVDTVELNGPFDAGDIVTVTVGMTPFSYTVKVGESASAALSALITAINADLDLAVTASDVSGVLTLTADVAGTAFTASSGVTQVEVSNGTADRDTITGNIAADVAQVTNVNFVGANTVEQGDTFTLVIDGDGAGSLEPRTISYTTGVGEGWFDILSALGEEIDAANLSLTWEVVVANSGDSAADYTLQLTASIAGTPFTVSASATNRPAGEVNTAAEVAGSIDNVVAVDPIAQISTIDLGNDTLDAGDVVSLTINDVVYDYTVTGQEPNNSAIVNALVSRLASAPVSASNAEGKLQLTGNANGSTFTVAAAINNIALQTNAGQVVVDDSTTPNVDAVIAVAQQSTVTFDFAGGNEPGDTYRITLDVDGDGDAAPITVEFVTIGDETLAGIAATLQDKLAQRTDAVTVTMVERVLGSGIYDQLLFAATVAGTPFTVTPEVINRTEGELVNSAPTVGVVTDNVAGVEAVAQQSTVTLTGADFEAGDTYSITIDADGAGSLQSFTVDVVSVADETLGNIAQALQDAIDGKQAPLTVSVQESVLGSGIFDQLLIVANNPGTPFTVSSTVTNRDVGATDDNTALAVTTQDNVEAVAEQAQVSLINFQENLITGDTLYIAIDHDGQPGIDRMFFAELLAGQSVNDLLFNLETQIENAGIGFTADVDGTQITLTGVAAESFTLEAGYNLPLVV